MTARAFDAPANWFRLKRNYPLRRTLSLAAAVSLLALQPALALAKPADADTKAETAKTDDPDGIPDPDSATTTRFSSRARCCPAAR
jgi:hypothetical protein